MLKLPWKVRIYLAAGYTDMRKGMLGLMALAAGHVEKPRSDGALFVFRGKRSDRIKIVWFDGQGFCLFYKCLERGKFIWPNAGATGVVGITEGQLSMLLEGIDWRNPAWTAPPERIC